MKKEKFHLEDCLYEEEKVSLFIDGANLYGAAKALNLDIDYKLLKRQFSRYGRLVRIYYYTAILEEADYSPVRPLVDWLDYNGYSLITKPVREYVDANGKKKVKGSMDIDLAVDAMLGADYLDHIILFSGDGDYRSLVEGLQKKGCRVTVVSTIMTQPPMIADELRRQADMFVDLNDLRPYIEKEKRASSSVNKENSSFVQDLQEIIQ